MKKPVNITIFRAGCYGNKSNQLCDFSEEIVASCQPQKLVIPINLLDHYRSRHPGPSAMSHFLLLDLDNVNKSMGSTNMAERH